MSLQRVSGAEPLARNQGRSALKLSAFLHLHNLRSLPICPKIYSCKTNFVGRLGVWPPGPPLNPPVDVMFCFYYSTLLVFRERSVTHCNVTTVSFGLRSIKSRKKASDCLPSINYMYVIINSFHVILKQTINNETAVATLK